MMRSMFSAVSGLRIHQTKMDVIANNIANVNTVGFKSSRTIFSEVFNQTIASASAANESTGRGGTNPMQVGLGSTVASIDVIMNQGSTQRTDNPFDLMIQGDGFFIFGDNTGTYFSRAGALNLDKNGNLVGAGGLNLYGWEAVNDPTNPSYYTIQKGKVQPIKISGEKEYVLPKSTKFINFSGNFNAQTNPVQNNTMSFFDSVGNRYTVDVEFVFDSTTNSWNYNIFTDAYVEGDTGNIIPINITPVTGSIQFDTNGLPIAPANIDIAVTPGATPLVPNATFGNAGVINIDFSNLTGFGNELATAKSSSLDGNSPGTLNGLNIGFDGKIIGKYTNGDTKLLGQVPLAVFKNPAGLEKVGNNLFINTTNSGDFDGIGSEVGGLQGGVLEMSNVDLSSEFTEMITTQRGFQANSRVITTSDDMLQELVNLKR